MLNRHHRLALLACSATLALSAASNGLAQNATASQQAEAETTESAKQGETYLSTIVVKGGREADPYVKPGPSSVVSRDEINLQAGQETDDLLRGVPGTSTANNPQNPGVAVNIRGFEGSGRVNMMIDGVRQNFRCTGHEAQGFAYVDPAFLSEIDLTRGFLGNRLGPLESGCGQEGGAALQIERDGTERLPRVLVGGVPRDPGKLLGPRRRPHGDHQAGPDAELTQQRRRDLRSARRHEDRRPSRKRAVQVARNVLAPYF